MSTQRTTSALKTVYGLGGDQNFEATKYGMDFGKVTQVTLCNPFR